MDKKVNNHERYVSLLSLVKRDGIDDLMRWLEETDFYEAPASHAYHGSYPGGLCEHSLNVYDELKRLLTAYPEINVSGESVIVTSLLHDLCKVDFYVAEKRNRKNASGQWESYDSYTVKEKFCFGGHGSKSVFLAQHFIKLTPEEAVAINCHMGAFESDKVGKSFEKFPLAWALHVADEAATYLKEKKEV